MSQQTPTPDYPYDAILLSLRSVNLSGVDLSGANLGSDGLLLRGHAAEIDAPSKEGEDGKPKEGTLDQNSKVKEAKAKARAEKTAEGPEI